MPRTRGTSRAGRAIRRRTRSAVCLETPMPSADSRRDPARPANSRSGADLAGQPHDTPLVTVQDAGNLLAERLPRAARHRAAHPADLDLHQDTVAVDGNVGRRPLVIAVHPRGFPAARRAGHGPVTGPGPAAALLARVLNIVD